MILLKLVFFMVGIILGYFIVMRLKYYRLYLKTRRICDNLEKKHDCKITIEHFRIK